MLTKFFTTDLDITKFQMLNSSSKYVVTIVICIVYVIIFIIISNAVAWCLSLVFEHLSKLMYYFSKCTTSLNAPLLGDSTTTAANTKANVTPEVFFTGKKEAQ